MSKKITEYSEQIKLVNWFRLQYPKHKYLLTHFANGGYRGAKSGSLFKALGVVAGYPDLVLFLPRNRFHVLFIEMKKPIVPGKPKAYISSEQKSIMQLLKEQGYCVTLAYGFDQAKSIILEYMSDKDD